MEDIYTNQAIDSSKYSSGSFSLSNAKETIARFKVSSGQWKDNFITQKYYFFCERDQS